MVAGRSNQPDPRTTFSRDETMKLMRVGAPGAEKPAILAADGTIRDLSAHVADIGGAAIGPEGLAKIAAIDTATLPVVSADTRIGPCVAGTGKFICIGLNYSDHAAETGATVPPEPIIFMKATSAIVGPNDNVLIPRGSEKTDWEVELAVIIGKTAKYVSEDEAMDYVAGYAVSDDVSERAFQTERAGQWTKGKSCDTFGPIGPWLVTKDEIADPQNLKMWLTVNGHKFQDGTTATMVYGVKHLVSYLSQFMSLHPGDVISTGTPPGVGMGQKPPRYLKDGDVVELGIEGLGTQKQTFVQDK
jgi:2-keto-4-pentenoate hydratase/2-oxohepta-3-ene-1,7-dioic acid hydratase in catechol pathway